MTSSLHIEIKRRAPTVWRGAGNFEEVVPLVNVENAKQPDAEGNLPLHKAILRGSKAYKLVKKLVEIFPEGVRHANKNGQLPIHDLLDEAWNMYSVNEILDCLKLISDLFPECLLKKDGHGNVPLQFASSWRRLSKVVVKYLIEACPESVKIMNNNGNLPLHTAAKWGSNDASWLLPLLITAYPEALKASNKNGNLPLHLAALLGGDRDNSNCIELLLQAYPEGAKVANKDNELPLHVAVEKGNTKSAPLLLENHSEALKIVNKNGDLPLHLAILKGNLDAFTLFLEKHPEAATIVREDGNTSLHLAASSKRFAEADINYSAVIRLAKSFPKALQMANSNGDVPLHLASLNSYASIAFVLLLFRSYPDAIKVVNKAGNLPIHLIGQKNGNISDYLDPFLDFFPESVKVPNNLNELPLHSAIKTRNIKLAESLAKIYPEAMKVPDNYGNLPLHLAAMNDISLARLFIEMCPECVKAPNKEGNTPLHIAAKGNCPGIFESLIKKYPEAVTMPNAKGKLPCDLTSYGRIEIMYIIGRYCPRSYQAKHQTYVKNQIVEYLQGTSNFAKCRVREIQHMLKCITSPERNSDTVFESDEENAETVRNLKESQQKDAGIIEDLKDSQKKDALAIRQLKEELKNDAMTIKEFKEIQKEETKIIQGLKSAAALDSEKIASLDDQLKKEKRKNESIKACLLDATKILVEARRSESYRIFQEIKDSLSLKDLKSVLTSFSSRLTVLKKKVLPERKLSTLEKYVKSMFILCDKGIEMERDDVYEVITEINKELVMLEKSDVTPATAVNNGTTAVARDINMDIEKNATSVSPQNIPRKRARISISPS